MDFKDYFQQEMLSLRQIGREALERNPSLEPFLGTPGRDPDVERLFESFSFLSARLREKLDDELPEITHGLFSLLWTNYLRPLPASSIIQYQLTGNITGGVNIPRGTMVDSIPVDDTVCKFQTIYDTEVLPLEITEQRLFERGGDIILAVRFSLTSGTLAALPLSRLRFFFSGEATVSRSIYFTLLRLVNELRFVVQDKNLEEHVTAVLPPSSVTPLGFSEGEGMCPYPSETLMGYRILQEYFCFPEKFMFLDICGLEQGIGRNLPPGVLDAKAFELHFVLKSVPENHESFRAENWKLFCTPVINIFPFALQSQKISQNHGGTRIIPNASRPDHFSVYSVDRVVVWDEEGKAVEAYKNIASHEGLRYDHAAAPKYRLEIKPSTSREDVETYIVIASDKQPKGMLNLDLLCTNSSLPARLGMGDICVHSGSGGASSAPFKNILPVSAAHPPPFKGEMLWKILSNMSLNYIPLSNVEAFREILGVYHFRALYERRSARHLVQSLAGITAIESGAKDRIFKGFPVRGTQTRMTLNQENFSCEGELYLFASVLNEFLALYATENGFHQLVVKNSTNGKEYDWPIKIGKFLQG